MKNSFKCGDGVERDLVGNNPGEPSWTIQDAKVYGSRLIVTNEPGGCLLTIVGPDGVFASFRVTDKTEHQVNAAIFQAMRFKGPFDQSEEDA